MKRKSRFNILPSIITFLNKCFFAVTTSIKINLTWEAKYLSAQNSVTNKIILYIPVTIKTYANIYNFVCGIGVR